MGFQSLEEMVKSAKEQKKEIWEIVLEDDMQERGVDREESMQTMQVMYENMKKADQGYDRKLRSASDLVGEDGARLEAAREEGRLISGQLISQVMEKAVKMGESNACMKRIVAAPTAGSCGVIPAVFLSYQEQYQVSDEEMTKALYVAAGIGSVIAERAFIAGATGGCQAEIGSASAMAAGALCALRGGNCEQIMHAGAMALKGLLGLACDPVGGLVEVPCVKRNVIGAVNAITASDMAIAGLTSRIPPDEVIDAMRSIGLSMPASIRETGEGGLAGTPTGQRIAEELLS